MKVRPAKVAEWHVLWELERECFPPGTAYDWQEFVAAMKGCAAVLVAEGHLGIVGFLALEIEGETAIVENIAVDPNLRGNQIARRLMEAGIDAARAKGCKRMALQVAKRNPDAIAAFSKLGFGVTRELPGYYVSPAWAGDALEMERAL